jgi:hypothetical protein
MSLQEAESLIKEGENNLKPKTSWFGLFNTVDYFEASSCYFNAGNIFKSLKECKLSLNKNKNMKLKILIFKFF